jgi:hypothetical protein
VRLLRNEGCWAISYLNMRCIWNGRVITRGDAFAYYDPMSVSVLLNLRVKARGPSQTLAVSELLFCRQKFDGDISLV